MPQLFPPLRPKRAAAEISPEPLRIPGARKRSLNNQILEVSDSLVLKPEPATPRMQTDELPIAQPVQEQASYNDTMHEDPSHQPHENLMWPSEIHSQYSTMWLLPPYTDQSSTIAMLLQTEIQAHNITREMLHATEQRRLGAVQRCNHFQLDIRNWTAAHNNLTFVFGKCSEELSRLRADNEEMRMRLQELGIFSDDAYNSRWVDYDQDERVRSPYTSGNCSPT